MRVTAVATLVLAVALFVGSNAFLRALRHSQLADIEASAKAKTTELVTAVKAGTAHGLLAAARDSTLFVQVIDSTGHVLAATPNVSDMTAYVDVGDRPAIAGRTVKSDADVDGAGCLLWTTGVEVGGRTIGVYVAAPLRSMRRSMAMLRSQLLRVSPVVLLATAIALWFVVGRALRPVDVLREEVDLISASELHRRVSPPPVDDEVGRLARTMNALLDRLQSAAERQTRFVSDASHELRSPLAFVRTRLEVALRNRDRTDWPATAEDVLRESQRMERLVGDLLVLARSDGRDLLRNPKQVDLDEVVLDEVRATRQVLSGRIALDARGVSAGRVRGDADLLRRVVANILVNATRYAATSVRLSVAVEPGREGQRDEVVLQIVDDGPGIPAEEHDRIFVRFSRIDEARARGTGGAGLGLAIVREIVAAHGGTVEASNASGGGAQFTVRLPSAG